MIGTASTAGAQSGCGEFSFGFEGTRLLNDGISNSAGPYPIELPAGTYTITAHSFDDHVDHPGQIEQTQEQWYIALDSGYVSPTTDDIPDEGTFVTSIFNDQKIDASTSITLHHLGEGGVNSVSPMCVGFTTVEEPEIAGPVIVEPPVVVEAPIVIEPPVVVEAPIVIEPPVVVEAPVIEEPPVVVEVKQVVEVKEPVAAAPAAPEAQLALTGPTSMTWTMIGAGFGLLLLGAALVLEERRRLI